MALSIYRTTDAFGIVVILILGVAMEHYCGKRTGGKQGLHYRRQLNP